MTSEQRGKWYADSLRDKYNKILAKNGTLTDENYQEMIDDVQKCTDKEPGCRDMLFDVLEEFDGRNKNDSRAETTNPNAS